MTDNRSSTGEEEYVQGWNDALERAELELRRHFQKLWPHDQNTAKILQRLAKQSTTPEPIDD